MSVASDARFAALPVRPGKIIAVHLSYSSRAAQRGRQPAQPSYFFKATSSISGSGDEVARPEGTELFAFEGEIALIIGEDARAVSLDDAWGHVGWVTASNDLGVYDLRPNDKGSNVRSKSRDGYTPVGPHLIEAARLDPEAIRIRTWLNGELVQDDSSSGMFFSLPRFVADLSQHFTLERGDIILTGTPAGSSVAQPGDRIEVEVDATALDGEAVSSGRLVTLVTEEPALFDERVGSLPAADDQQREDAWGSREAAGLPPASSASDSAASATTATAAASATDSRPASADPLDDELRELLERAPVAGLSAQLRKAGLVSCFIDGVLPMHPEQKLIGRAKTLRFVPFREDLFKRFGAGQNAQKEAFDEVEPGEVIVIEARGERGSGTLGDVLALRALVRGAAGVVTDGGVRDWRAVAEVGLPVFAQGPHPSVLGRKHVPWEHDVTVACGGATVQPGDIIVGDRDGVIVIPPELAREIAERAVAQEDEDEFVAEQVRAGHPVDGLFPMNSSWRARFEAQRASDDAAR